MPPGGVHLACGCLLSRFGLPAAPRVVPARHTTSLRAAVVFGSIVPDFDLLLTALAVAITENKRYIDTLHRTFSHSIPIIIVVTLLSMWRMRWRRGAPPAAADAPVPTGRRDPALWRALLWLAGAHASDAAAGDAIAACLGVAAGCILHTLADVFYVVPVQLLWPHPRQFTYPLLLPPKAEFTNALFKRAMLADFASDSLYFLPILYVCATYRLHETRWRRFALFWAFQIVIIVAHLHPALMDDSYHHEDFIYWLHCPCGLLFILVLNCSPLALCDAVRVLASPRGAAQEAARHRMMKAVDADVAADVAAAPLERALSAVGDAGQAACGVASAASSGASAPVSPTDDVATAPPPVTQQQAAPAAPPAMPRRTRALGSAATLGALRRRSSLGSAPLLGSRRTAASASALTYATADGADGSDSECSSPQRLLQQHL